MEGVAAEAASLAGHLKLGKLIYLYDDNQVTIEGFTDLAFSEDVPKRFEALGWHTLTVRTEIIWMKSKPQFARRSQLRISRV